jgi:hypothetical protein
MAAMVEMQFRTAAAQGPILINPVIYAELAPAFASAQDAVSGRVVRGTSIPSIPPRWWH